MNLNHEALKDRGGRALNRTGRCTAAFVACMLGLAVAVHGQATTAPAAGQAPTATRPGETVITFEKYDIGKPVKSVTEKGVTFALAGPLQRSAAEPQVMFFPHLNPAHAGNPAADPKGILNAMSNEQGIPIKITFPAEVTSVTLDMWASTATPVLVEAHDKTGKLLDSASLPNAPERSRPSDPIPTFELTVKGEHIAYVLFGGARTDEFIAAEQVRFTPAAAETPPATAPHP